MIATELWQHRTSGEVYVVRLDEHGRVVAAAGPLQPEEHQAPLAEDFEGQPGLAEDIDRARDEYALHACTDHAT
jgi:hypothetical protein